MTEKDSLTGLSCPRCGGMVPIPEGQEIVNCPFCGLSSVVRGENGVRRYEVPCRVEREKALEGFRSFLRGGMQIAGSAKREAQVSEMFLMHLPFWSAWGRAVGWVFGEERHTSNKSTHYEPKEVRIVEEMSWNSAACEVGEFGVTNINLSGRPLQPFNPDELHHTGMVFEPSGSAEESLARAKKVFENRANQKAHLDRVSQTIVNIIRPRLGLVYYPLWVVRYLFRGRVFQVVVDGFSGEVLYGKAPGSVMYRAVAMVGGMAAGAFIGVNGPAMMLRASDSDKSMEGALIAIAIGGVLMFGSYRIYRFGEHYEYRRYKDAGEGGFFSSMPTSLSAVGNIIRELSDLRR
jgi:hypothetical protein